MAKTKKKPAAKGKAKAKAKKKSGGKKTAAAKPKKAAKAKKGARPKAARAAARRPAKTAKKVSKRPAKRAVPKARPAAAPVEGNIVPVSDESGAIPGRSTTTLLQTVDLHAPPDEVYRAYMLGPRHAEFTKSPADVDGRVGGRMSAWDGYISGEFLQLEEGRRIVQTWRTTEWPEGYDDSKLELTFTPTDGGTRVTMVHSNVPSEQARRYDDAWKEHYWEPLKKYLSWEQPVS